MALTPVTVRLNGTGKTVQPTTTKFRLRQCLRTDAAKDRISMLPDDVLVSILSRLKLKEAARTSVLSNRWRYLWTFIRILDFTDPPMASVSILRRRFIDFVNKVLKSYNGPTIDEFRISFNVDDKKCYKFDIENCIKFALERGVNRLELSLTSRHKLLGPYELKTQFLRNYRLYSIQSLRLQKVDVTEEVVDYILSHCPSLEFLYMGNSKSLINLKVLGPTLRLKHLEIYLYWNANLHFKDVPHLAELSLKGECALSLIRNRWLFSTLLSNLETLVLDLDGGKVETFLKFPKLTNLRKLDFTLEAWYLRKIVHGIPLLMVLLEVSPLLHTLALEFVGLEEDDTTDWRRLIELNKVQKANGPHQCLKIFKLVAFVGFEVEIEVAKDILNIAVSLEKLIIHTSSPRYDTGNPEEKSIARTRARQLEMVLPLGAKLEIL